MKYIIFNNSILIGDGENVQFIDKSQDPEQIKLDLDKVKVCMVDIDVLLAAAAGTQEQKDSILVRKFTALYQHEPYVIQDEGIDNNLYQIIGIKEQKVREVYSLIPADRIDTFVPYALALRNTLENNNISLNKYVVFVDDLVSERLVTVFDGKKFSRTRIIANSGENILPEIKRSQIEFNKKTEEFAGVKNKEFVIVVNSKKLSEEITKNDESMKVEFLDIPYPAIEGLKELETTIKYTLPEVNLKKKHDIEIKRKAKVLMASLFFIGLGLLYFLFTRIELATANNQYAIAQQDQDKLNSELEQLDKETYRSDLKSQGQLNFGITYEAMVEIIPASYTVTSFHINRGDNWTVEMTLLSDEGSTFEQIPRVNILKNAEIKDVFVNNQPGKHLKVTL
jgi:hypothetical protein